VRLSFEVGEAEKSRLEFNRDWFTGRTVMTVNGNPIELASPWDLSTHFSAQLTQRYQFTVGDKERHEVVIEKKRPLFLGGFRRHMYQVFVDNSLVAESYGF
jgi:hypothetical protein